VQARRRLWHHLQVRPRYACLRLRRVPPLVTACHVRRPGAA
jgi:hypothetical protein